MIDHYTWVVKTNFRTALEWSTPLLASWGAAFGLLTLV